uniref:hypothetical protein n=1 Tax=Streptomyces sp. CA-141956 TaxID=3240051 RepID=UPI003F494553
MCLIGNLRVPGEGETTRLVDAEFRYRGHWVPDWVCTHDPWDGPIHAPGSGSGGILAAMRHVRIVGTVVAGIAAAVLMAGCSSGGGDDAAPPAAASSTPAAKSVDDALDPFKRAVNASCATADECQAKMTNALAAADELRTAMRAKDPQLCPEPIGLVNLSEERADDFGRDNLGAKGNSYITLKPLLDVVEWFALHPEG